MQQLVEGDLQEVICVPTAPSSAEPEPVRQAQGYGVPTPHSDLVVIAGQVTLGRALLAQALDLDAVFVGVG